MTYSLSARRELLAFIGLAVLAVAACSESAAPVRPVRPAVGPVAGSATTSKTGGRGGGGVTPLNLKDWYDCSSWDGMQTWSCVYVGTSGTPDYTPGIQPGEGYDYLFTIDCSTNPNMCPTSGGSSLGGSYGITPVVSVQNDSLSLWQPNCPNWNDKWEHAYCSGKNVNDDPTRKARVTAAITRMRNKGGFCATMAAVADTLLAKGWIHAYSRKADPSFSGFVAASDFGSALPANGGATGAYSWIAIDAEYTDLWRDSVHHSTVTFNGRTYYGDLQETLGHELDHMLGVTPVHTDPNNQDTPHSQSCSDLVNP